MTRHFIALLLGATLATSCTPPESSTQVTQPMVSKAGTNDAQHGVSTMVLYRPANSTFYVRHGDDGQAASELGFGAPGDIPLWADFNGDGKNVPGLYRNGRWLISSHADSTADVEIDFGGAPGDVPLAADIDGDGRADLVIFRNGQWIVRGTRDPSRLLNFQFGQAGDIPVLADFDGSGKIDLAVFRHGQWFIDTERNGTAKMTLNFGGSADRFPIASHNTGTHGSSPALFRDGMWIVGTAANAPMIEVAFGASGDIPVFLETKD
ncbi:MAG: VCBS repeat-containing protein [Proteobacteria bacterium]|nr:VCBS repeat-containing protein [Pseudomonadota bacterium]